MAHKGEKKKKNVYYAFIDFDLWPARYLFEINPHIHLIENVRKI